MILTINIQSAGYAMKQLCKMKKDEISTCFKKLTDITGKPKFMCTKCARVAKDEKYLCRPASLAK